MMVARPRYLAVAAFVAGAAGLLASCSSGRPWYWTRHSAWGPPALVRRDGHVRGVGDCAALLVIPALKLTMHLGQQIDVHMSAGPPPHSSRPSVLIPGAIGPDQSTGTYQAV